LRNDAFFFTVADYSQDKPLSQTQKRNDREEKEERSHTHRARLLLGLNRSFIVIIRRVPRAFFKETN
jgi:hypothetical protein